MALGKRQSHMLEQIRERIPTEARCPARRPGLEVGQNVLMGSLAIAQTDADES